MTDGIALPAGTELWVAGPPEPIGAEQRPAMRPGAWQSSFPDERLIRTHFVHPGGAPLYCRMSQLELLADGRDLVDAVDVRTVPGVDLTAVWVCRDRDACDG